MITLNFAPGTIWTGDNLDIMRGMNDGCVDLIYLDPPYNSGEEWKAPIGSKAAGAAFKDAWTLNDIDQEAYAIMAESPLKAHKVVVAAGEQAMLTHGPSMKSYLLYMGERLIEMHRILADTGTLYLHVDPTASHYLKPVLDGLFGKVGFRNEIVWEYRTGGIPANDFARKHDTILRYVKGKEWTFNKPKERSRKEANFNLVDESGRRYYEKAGNRYYMDEGVAVTTVWDISPVRRQSKEKVGYPTQKPIALLERIVAASSNLGDLVFDPFCGCATTMVAAAQLGRNWIGADLSGKAVELLEERLANVDLMSPCKVNPLTEPPARTDLEKVSKKDLLWEAFRAQDEKCVGCGEHFPCRVMELDRIVPGKRGGQYARGNVQALCSHCNRSKGPLTMPEWRAKKGQKNRGYKVG